MNTSRWIARAFVLGLLASAPVFTTGCSGVESGDEQDASASAGVFQTFKGADGQYYFHLVAKNNERVLVSEGYSSKSKATKGIESVKTNGVASKNFKVLQASSGEWYFNLVAGNGEVIGTSELFATKTAATKSSKSVKTLIAKELRTEAAKTGGAKFELVDGADGDTYFHLKAGNGEIVLQSEGYDSDEGALSGIESVRTNAREASAFEIIDTDDGHAFFHVVAGNNEIIAVSEIFSSHANAERSAESVQDLIASEKVADPK